MNEDYTILIVDDDERNVDVLRTKLDSEGYKVVTAQDGEGALFAFERERPDMVLLDVMMPGLDGRKICGLMKDRSGDVFVPVMLVTAMTSGDAKAEGFEAGADDYLTKPIDLTELLARVRNLQKLQKLANQGERKRITESTYRQAGTRIDEVFKVLADGLSKGSGTLYRVQNGDEVGYLAVDDYCIRHARVGNETGRRALETMVVWPAAQAEAISTNGHETEFELYFDEIFDWWKKRLDTWRVMSEKLPPKSARLIANAERAGEAERLGEAFAAVFGLFGESKTVDAALRGSPLDILETMQVLGELFYRGLLKRDGLPTNAVTGSPLAAEGEEPRSLSSVSASVPKPAPDETFVEMSGESAVELASLREEALSLNATNDELRHENMTLQNDIMELRRKFDEASSRPAVDTEANGAVQEELEKTRQDLASARQQAADVEAARAMVQQQLDQKLEANNQSQHEIERLKKELQQTSVYAREWEDEKRAVETRIGMLQQSISELNNQIMRANTNNSKLQAQLKDREQELEEALSKPASSKASDGEAEASLRRIVKSKDDEIEKLSNQILSAQAKNDSQAFRLQEVEADAKLGAQAAELKARLEEKEAEIAKLKEEAEKPIDLEEGIDPQTGMAAPEDDGEDAEALRKEIRQREADVESLREQLLAAASKSEDQEMMIHELERLMDQQRDEYDRLQKKMEGSV